MLAIYLAMLEEESDRQRFVQLYEAYEKKLYAVALKILNDPSQAEDAAQQAWLGILNHWQRVSALPWAETEGYVVTAAKHAAIDLLRANKHIADFPEDWDPPAPSENDTEYRYLVSLVHALPESYRMILELKLVEEWSNREIARRLNMNESTVATRIKRGRAILMDTMKKEGYCCD